MSSLGKMLPDAANAERDSSAYRDAPDPTSMSAFGLQWTLVEEGVERFAASADTQSAAAPASTAPARAALAGGEMPGKYDDIIGLSRPKSLRPAMPLRDRAAQFAPFAALTGYDASVQNAARAMAAHIEEIDRGIPIELEEMVFPAGDDFDEYKAFDDFASFKDW
mgnify:CR=1 FL=1